MRISRRSVLAGATGLALCGVCSGDESPLPAGPGARSQRYRIGACDWMMLKRQRPGAIPLGKEVGVDGVEVDMGGLGDRPTFDNKLTDPAFREQILGPARSLGIEICSLAMSGYYAQSFPEREGAERTVC